MEKVDFHDKYRDFPWKTSPSHAPKEAYDGSEVEDDWRAAWNVIAELPTDASEGEDGTWGCGWGRWPNGGFHPSFNGVMVGGMWWWVEYQLEYITLKCFLVKLLREYK